MSQDIDREYPGTSTKGLNCDLSFTKTLVNEITQSYQRYGDETIEIGTREIKNTETEGSERRMVRSSTQTAMGGWTEGSHERTTWNGLYGSRV